MLKFKRFSFFLLTIVILILIALNIGIKDDRMLVSEYKSIVDKYLGKQFILPSNLPIIYKLADSISHPDLFNNKFKICTSILSDCMPCIQELMEWDTLIKKLNPNADVSFLFYINTRDYEVFMNDFYPEAMIRYPIILDTLNLFCSLNNLDPNNKLYNTFLLDENNKVLLIGNPIKGIAIRELYFNTLSAVK